MAFFSKLIRVAAAAAFALSASALQAVNVHVQHERASVSVYYDASTNGTFAECAEGPAAYMQDCAMPSDMFMYLQSQKPVLVPKTDSISCTALGYELVGLGESNGVGISHLPPQAPQLHDIIR